MERTRGALTRYLLGAFGVTWVFWLPVTLATYGLPSFSNPYVGSWFEDFIALRASTPAHWLILGGGVLGPLAGAVLAWHHRAGPAGLRTLSAHVFDLRISDWKGWIGALLPLAYFALASLVAFALTGVTFRSAEGPLPFMGLLVAGCVLVAGEEVGWRGTQLPLLQESRSAGRSSFIVAVTWACWHIPLILMWNAGPDQSAAAAGLALIPYLLLTIPMAVMHTFAFNTARGLVAVSILLHALHNHLNAVLTTSPAPDTALARFSDLSGVILLVVFWVVATVLWAGFGGRDLSRRPRVTASSMLG